MKPERRSIALLVDSLSADYSMSIWSAVKHAAERNDAEVMAVLGMRVGSPNVTEATRNRIYELVTPSRIDGVIVVSSVIAHYCGATGIAELCRDFAPMPLCSIGLELEKIPSLIVHNRLGMELGVSHLLDVHARRRIAFIAAQVDCYESNERLAGYKKALADRGIQFDEHLVYYADFTMSGGALAMRHLLESAVEFDAVVAANDYMAMAAMNVLRARGRRVPADIPVCGFDDSSHSSCSRPTLSTLRQPARWLGNEAVELILRQLHGDSVPMLSVGEIELVRRESCGCGHRVTTTLQPIGPKLGDLREILQRERGSLELKFHGMVLDPCHALGNWPRTILDALDEELSGSEGRFVSAFETLLECALTEQVSLDEFQRIITLLRAELRRHLVVNDKRERSLEHIWHAARLMVGAASTRIIGLQRNELQHTTTLLGRSGERFATTLSLPLLGKALTEQLPALNVDQGAVCLFEHGFESDLNPLVVMRGGDEVTIEDQRIARERIAPDEALSSNAVFHSVVMPLTFEKEFLGVAVFAGSAVPNVYESLRQQIGAAIKGALLHRQVITEVAARERLDHQRMTAEARMASEIQLSMTPRTVQVPGLEIAHIMIPTAEAGGDYYDILPDDAGAWLAIGDVSGHGLATGLIMLMLQSMVATLARNSRTVEPSTIVSVVNEVLYENVRNRLLRDEHATLTVFRYERSGRIRFAGLHEPVIVYRKGLGRCETVTPPGFWVGAIPDVRRFVQNSELQLGDGDLLVLYTDGVTEPRNVHLEQFGLERLVGVIEDCANLPVLTIRDRVLDAVRGWCVCLDDDVALVVARYHAAD